MPYLLNAISTYLPWENNHAVSAKQRSSCKNVYRVHDNSKVWPLLNFHELQTEKFPDFSLLSKNPLKLIILCRNGGNTSLQQLSSENQYNYGISSSFKMFHIL